jgi:hypothetical protein
VQTVGHLILESRTHLGHKWVYPACLVCQLNVTFNVKKDLCSHSSFWILDHFSHFLTFSDMCMSLGRKDSYGLQGCLLDSAS